MYQIKNFIQNIVSYNYCSNPSNYINIGYGIDNNYARCCASSIASFCLNNPTKNFNFHIMAKNYLLIIKIDLNNLLNYTL